MLTFQGRHAWPPANTCTELPTSCLGPVWVLSLLVQLCCHPGWAHSHPAGLLWRNGGQVVPGGGPWQSWGAGSVCLLPSPSFQLLVFFSFCFYFINQSDMESHKDVLSFSLKWKKKDYLKMFFSQAHRKYALVEGIYKSELIKIQENKKPRFGWQFSSLELYTEISYIIITYIKYVYIHTIHIYVCVYIFFLR